MPSIDSGILIHFFLLFRPQLSIYFSKLQLDLYRMSQSLKPSSFISKFHSIIRNRSYQGIINFDHTNSTILIIDKEKLEAQVLPHFFRHNKFTSFIRQLNLYGFKKIKKSAYLSFTHPTLQNGQKFLSITAKKKQRNVVLPEERSHTELDQEFSLVSNRVTEQNREIIHPKYQMQASVPMNVFCQPFLMNQYQQFACFVPAYHFKSMYNQE